MQAKTNNFTPDTNKNLYQNQGQDLRQNQGSVQHRFEIGIGLAGGYRARIGTSLEVVGKNETGAENSLFQNFYQTIPCVSDYQMGYGQVENS